MPIYSVELRGTIYVYATVEVEAETREDAVEAALLHEDPEWCDDEETRVDGALVQDVEAMDAECDEEEARESRDDTTPVLAEDL